MAWPSAKTLSVQLRDIIREGDEKRMVHAFVWISLGVHFIVLIIGQIDFSFFSSRVLVEEWAMDADLVPDLNMIAPSTSALPDSQKAEEAAVPKNLLPQLPKKFATDEAQPEEAGDSGDKLDPKAKPKELDKKEAPTIAADKEEQNRIKKEEALKRLAMERLRLEKKESDKLKAETKDAIARLKDQLGNDGKINAGVGGGSGVSQNKFMGAVRMAISRHYALPEAYNLKNADIAVVLAVVLNDSGNVIKVDVDKTSGDVAFDELALKALRDSSPLPKPPPELVGKPFTITFSPKTI